MANALQLRRGTTTQHNSFTGLAGEVTVDTDKETVVVHDGSTAGGFPLARASDLTNLDADTLDGKQLATIESEYQAFANTAAANVVDSAPGTLDTLNELAAALGDDANFSTTVTNSIATKLPLAGGTMTGTLGIHPSSNVAQIALTQSNVGANGDGWKLHSDGPNGGVLKIQRRSSGTDTTVITVQTNGQLVADNGINVTGNATFGDNGKAIFGDGSDLQIYHDGTDSYISGDGTVYLSSSTGNETYAKFVKNAESRFYYDNSSKLRTTSTGASVSGVLEADGVSLFGPLRTNEVIEKVGLSYGTSGDFDFNTTSFGVLYFPANQTANRNVNFSNVNANLANGQSITCAILMAQGSTAYYIPAYQVDGSTVTPKWSGGSAPTGGNASGIDVYTFTIIKTADATFTVLASQSQYA